jgi:putative transcriptional regulator
MRNRVREFRKQLNLTQEEFAKSLSVSRQTVIAIENDKYNPTLVLAIKMARLLNKPVEMVFILEQN